MAAAPSVPASPMIDTKWADLDGLSSPQLFGDPSALLSPTSIGLTHKLSRTNLHNLSFLVSGNGVLSAVMVFEGKGLLLSMCGMIST